MAVSEKKRAAEMEREIKKLINNWALDVFESDNSDFDKTRFHYLGEKIIKELGENGHQAWVLVMHGLSYAAYAEGKITTEKFEELKAALRPTVDEILRKVDNSKH